MARKIILELDIDADGAVQGVNKLDKSVDNAAESMNEASAAADKFTGGAISGIKNFAKGLKTAVLGLKTLKINLASTGIGLLVVAFGSLTAYFTKTERGAQALRVVTASLGGAFGALTDVAVSLGEALFNAISNPQKAVEELGESISYYFTEFIPNAFQKVLDGLGILGDAISELFAGNFSAAADKAAEGALKLGDGLIEMNPGTAIFKELVEGAAELGNEIQNDVKAAGNLERRLNALIVSERELSVETAKRRADIKELNQIAEDVTKTEEERIAAAKEAISIEQSLLNQRVANAQERLDIIREQNELSESGEEDFQKEADAEIALAQIRQESLELQTTLTNKLNTIEQQVEARREADRLKAEEERKAIEEVRLEIMQEGVEKELKLADNKYKELFKKAEGNAELEKELTEAKENEIEEIKKKYSDKELKEDEEVRLAIMQDGIEKELLLADKKYKELFEKAKGNAELEKQVTEAKENEIAGIEQKYAKDKKKLDEETTKATVANSANALNAFAELAGKGTGLAKGLAIASVLADSAAAAIGIFRSSTSLPEPAATINRGIQLAALAATTVKSLSSINSIQTPPGASGGGGGAGAAVSAPAPSFNVAGDAGQNQLADAVNARNAEPTKAYVVSSEVSSAQQLDRLTQNASRF